MSKHIQKPGTPSVEILFEGTPLRCTEGDPLAVALYRAGIFVLSRSIKFHRPRGFFCLTGDCASCLMRVDGEPNVRSCRVRVKEGMRAERQNAWPSAKLDLLSFADFFFPEGMDHHTLVTSPRPLNEAMQRVVRQLGGLGKLPEVGGTQETEALYGPPVQLQVDLVVVGAGPAGLAAAQSYAALHKDAAVLLLEGNDEVGGSYLSHPAYGKSLAQTKADEAERAGVRIRLETSVVGWYEEEGVLCAISRNPQGQQHLLRISATHYLYATGASEQNALFVDNDVPGVISARACGLLAFHHGVRPGHFPVVLGDTEYGKILGEGIAARTGKMPRTIDGKRERIVRVLASGSGPLKGWIRAIEVKDDRENCSEIPCDLLAVAIPPAPASALPRLHGIQVQLSKTGGGFQVVCGRTGQTTNQKVYCAGDVAGFVGVEQAAAHGALVGRSIRD